MASVSGVEVLNDVPSLTYQLVHETALRLELRGQYALSAAVLGRALAALDQMHLCATAAVSAHR